MDVLSENKKGWGFQRIANFFLAVSQNEGIKMFTTRPITLTMPVLYLEWLNVHSFLIIAFFSFL